MHFIVERLEFVAEIGTVVLLGQCERSPVDQLAVDEQIHIGHLPAGTGHTPYRLVHDLRFSQDVCEALLEMVGLAVHVGRIALPERIPYLHVLIVQSNLAGGIQILGVEQIIVQCPLLPELDLRTDVGGIVEIDGIEVLLLADHIVIGHCLPNPYPRIRKVVRDIVLKVLSGTERLVSGNKEHLLADTVAILRLSGQSAEDLVFHPIVVGPIDLNYVGGRISCLGVEYRFLGSVPLHSNRDHVLLGQLLDDVVHLVDRELTVGRIPDVCGEESDHGIDVFVGEERIDSLRNTYISDLRERLSFIGDTQFRIEVVGIVLIIEHILPSGTAVVGHRGQAFAMELALPVLESRSEGMDQLVDLLLLIVIEFVEIHPAVPEILYMEIA